MKVVTRPAPPGNRSGLPVPRITAAAVPILTITAGSVLMWNAGAGRWTLTGLCGSGPWILNRGGFSHGTSPGTFLCGTGRRRLAGPGAPLSPALALTGCFPLNTIAFAPGQLSVFKQDGEKLVVIGGI